MLIHLIDIDARKALLALIEDINRVQSAAWGLAFVKRRSLKFITNDFFVLAIKPALSDVTEAKVFVLDNGDFYIAWRGMQKKAHDQLRNIITLTLLQASGDPATALMYFDPLVMGNELTTLLRAQEREEAAAQLAPIETPAALFSKNIRQPNELQMKKFHEAVATRPERKQLQILVVEDQQLLRRLLHEVLRSGNAVDSVATLQEGWNVYLEKAPDIAFLDIGLADGSGHDLARAIKQIDPSSSVIMVTASNTMDEITEARANHVDGFVAKPYSKQQIFTYIDKHVATQRMNALKGKYT